MYAILVVMFAYGTIDRFTATPRTKYRIIAGPILKQRSRILSSFFANPSPSKNLAKRLVGNDLASLLQL